MKNQILKLGTAVAFVLITFSFIAQTKALDTELTRESKEALQEILDESPNLQTFYDQSTNPTDMPFSRK